MRAAEMIAPGQNGFLFPVNDTTALVHHLAALANPAVAARMGANARRMAESYFSEKSMLDRYEALLLDLCVRRPALGLAAM